jgi:hypothetical protein
MPANISFNFSAVNSTAKKFLAGAVMAELYVF